MALEMYLEVRERAGNDFLSEAFIASPQTTTYPEASFTALEVVPRCAHTLRSSLDLKVG